MKRELQTTLKHELLSAGASKSEADELAAVAQRLQALRAIPESQTTRPHFRLVPVLSVAVVAPLVGMALVTFSQPSLPGSWLYPVKRLSENTAVAANPNYRATLMMRRADEVRQLVADDAGADKVSATLSTYQAEATAYKSVNYPAFTYCRSNLKQAEQHANSAEKAQIAAVLKNLGDVN